MITDYYEKYGFSRTREQQLTYLKNTLRFEKTFFEGFSKETERLKGKLKEAEENGDKEQVKKLTEQILKNEKEIKEKGKLVGRIQKIMPNGELLENVSESELNTTYFTIHAEKMMYPLMRRYQSLDTSNPEDAEEIKKIKEKVLEIYEMYKTLTDPESKKKYDSELDYQKYLQTLERERKAREEAEVKYVKEVMGPNFDPNMSHCKRKINDFKWSVNLYREPEVLYIGKSNYPSTPQINQEIYAYRYGAFSFGMLIKDDGTPTYKDNLCEIIGVTKKAIDGTETTNFIIAPLRYTSKVKQAFADERGRLVTPRERTPQIAVSKKDEPKEEGIVSKLINGIAARKRDIKKPNTGKYISAEQPRYKKVIITQESRYQISPEESNFFANVYLSDYLINNAVRNNSHYIGTYDPNEKSGAKVSFDFPNEEDRINACYFAMFNPGDVTRKTATQTKRQTIRNIEELFDNLKLKQQVLFLEDSAKMRRIKGNSDRTEH